jgi:hypothetical protein
MSMRCGSNRSPRLPQSWSRLVEHRVQNGRAKRPPQSGPLHCLSPRTTPPSWSQRSPLQRLSLRFSLPCRSQSTPLQRRRLRFSLPCRSQSTPLQRLSLRFSLPCRSQSTPLQRQPLQRRPLQRPPLQFGWRPNRARPRLRGDQTRSPLPLKSESGQNPGRSQRQHRSRSAPRQLGRRQLKKG